MPDEKPQEFNLQDALKPDIEKERSPEIVKAAIMETYTEGVKVLGEALESNRKRLKDEVPVDELIGIQPRGAVIVALWEEDDSMLTAKMFRHSIADLIHQAESADIYARARGVVWTQNNHQSVETIRP